MKRSAAVICLIACLSFAVSSPAGEKKITKKDLPAAVLAAFEKTYPNATIKGLSSEKEKGTVYYEIESVDGKAKRDLLYLADGTVAEIEEAMPAVDLPDQVKAAVSAKYPKGEIAKAEKKTEGNDVSYELQVKVGKKKVELSFDPTGKLVK